MHFSFLRGDLPPAILTSCFFTDATGGYSGGVWGSPLRYVTAASDQGPSHHTVTYGVVAARRPPQ